MDSFSNNKGIALITTLLLSFIALIFIGTVMELVLTSTKLSGYLKSYVSAEEAARSGIIDFFDYKTLYSQNEGGFFNLHSSNWRPGHECKIFYNVVNSHDQWPVKCPEICGNGKIVECESHSAPEDIIDYYDWKKVYGNYVVYAKITKKIRVSSPEIAYGKNAYVGNSPEYFLYSIDFVATNNDNVSPQMAWFTVLYKATR